MPVYPIKQFLPTSHIFNVSSDTTLLVVTSHSRPSHLIITRFILAYAITILIRFSLIILFYNITLYNILKDYFIKIIFYSIKKEE